MKIVVYSKKECKFCVEAKRLLESKWLMFEEIDVIQSEDIKNEMISRANGKRTVPQIFINDKHIGGYTDLCQYFNVEPEIS